MAREREMRIYEQNLTSRSVWAELESRWWWCRCFKIKRNKGKRKRESWGQFKGAKRGGRENRKHIMMREIALVWTWRGDAGIRFFRKAHQGFKSERGIVASNFENFLSKASRRYKIFDQTWFYEKCCKFNKRE